jgi:hypothetical protein
LISGKTAILDRFQMENAGCILIKIREEQPGDVGKELDASQLLPRALGFIALALGVQTFHFVSLLRQLGMLPKAN